MTWMGVCVAFLKKQHLRGDLKGDTSTRPGPVRLPGSPGPRIPRSGVP